MIIRTSPPVPANCMRSKSSPAAAGPERRTAWDQALKSSGSGKLTDAVKAFEILTQGTQVEAEAWYNLGLTYAWLGNHPAAVAALDQYVYSEPDETQAAKAWALAEVLRYGQGMEEQADTVAHSVLFGVREPKALVAELEELKRTGQLAGAHVNEENVLFATILEAPPPALTPELQARQSLKIVATLTLMGNIVQLTGTDLPTLGAFAERLRQKLGAAAGPVQVMRGPAKFTDAISEALARSSQRFRSRRGKPAAFGKTLRNSSRRPGFTARSRALATSRRSTRSPV